MKFRATVSAIRADSFITFPRCPVTSKVPSPGALPSRDTLVPASNLRGAVSMNNVVPPNSYKLNVKL